MTQQIKCVGCSGDTIYGIVKDNKLYRLSFSKSLIEYIIKTHLSGQGYQYQAFDIVRGQELKPNEKIDSGIYAIVSKRKDIILRATPSFDIAQWLTDWGSRTIFQAWLIPKGKAT